MIGIGKIAPPAPKISGPAVLFAVYELPNFLPRSFQFVCVLSLSQILSSRAIIEEFFSLLSKDANTFLKEKVYGLTLLEIQRRHDWSDAYMESLHEEIKRLAQ